MGQVAGVGEGQKGRQAFPVAKGLGVGHSPHTPLTCAPDVHIHPGHSHTPDTCTSLTHPDTHPDIHAF